LDKKGLELPLRSWWGSREIAWLEQKCGLWIRAGIRCCRRWLM